MKKYLEHADIMNQITDNHFQKRDTHALKKARRLLKGKVARKIRRAARRGELSVRYPCYDEHIRRHLIQLLRENGYQAIKPVFYDHILISWNNIS